MSTAKSKDNPYNRKHREQRIAKNIRPNAGELVKSVLPEA